MEIRHLRQADYKAMPWRNGKGLTSEIEIHPRGATLMNGDFLWRLSSAEVSEDGPFSQFPGCDRIMALIEGEGMALEFENHTFIGKTGSLLQFEGESNVAGKLFNGKVRDWNLIFKRNSVDVISHLYEQELSGFFTQVGTYIVFVVNGAVELNVGHRHHLVLETFETLIVDLNGGGTLDVRLTPENKASFVWSQIFDKKISV